MKRNLINLSTIHSFRLLLAGLFLFLSISGISAYILFWSPAIRKELQEPYIYIKTGTTRHQLISQLRSQGLLLKPKLTDWLSIQYNLEPRPGRFKLSPRMGNLALMKFLNEGKQSPVVLILNNKRLLQEIAGTVSKVIEADSVSIMQVITDSIFLDKYGFQVDNAISVFIPNSYEFFWNTSASEFFDRMFRENRKFWTPERMEKAELLGLDTKEIATLASIVQKETNADQEKSRIAGVYLNRLRSPGWKLQADPTVVFAWKDFGMRRVLRKHLEIDSPYNTYKYAGLPPGPICMPSIRSIDETLNAEKHDFMYFCAKPDGSGTHAFAKTYTEHLTNARNYHKYLRIRD